MYEKIVNFFESNLCIENIYFRKKYKLWIFSIIAIVLLELMCNFILTKIFNNIWISIILILFSDLLITSIILFFAYVLPINKIYKYKFNENTKLDLVGLLMKEERLSLYREKEIKEMQFFLKKKCKMNNIESINTIIDMINEEIKEKYVKKNFVEKYFNNTILPIIILILTIYFTNTNEQNLANILMLTIISIIPIILTGNFLNKFKNINITPVNKKENLLENMVFFFDESFHSRKINNKTIEDKEFFDNYVMTGIGCLKRDLHKNEILYAQFEERFKKLFSINENDELKSNIVKKEQYKYGIKSFNKKSLELYKDFWKLMNKSDYIYYICVVSKLEYILKQEIGKVIDWSKVDKEDYLLAMERSPVKDIEIKYLLKNALQF